MRPGSRAWSLLGACGLAMATGLVPCASGGATAPTASPDAAAPASPAGLGGAAEGTPAAGSAPAAGGAPAPPAVSGAVPGSPVPGATRGPATAAATAFTVDELRARAPIATYQLERAYYEHLLEVARALARERGAPGARPPTIRGLEPPTRPRIALDASAAPRIGPPDAAVTITVVENLSQVYTQRLDPVLQRLRRRFGTALAHVSWVERTHRHAASAAVAARCAHRQGRFWEYRGLLLAHLQAQESDALLDYAAELGLDGGAFRACLDGDEARAAVLADTAAAEAAGITRAPTLLVEGIYVAGSEPEEAIAAVVEAVEPAPGALPESDLPLDVTGIIRIPERAPEAIVVRRDDRTGRVVTIGDRLAADVVVVRVLADAVVVTRAGRRERLPLRAAASMPGAAPLADPGEPVRSDRALVTEHVHTLAIDRDLVARLVAARAAIAAQFTPGALEVGGQRLLKLTGREHGALLARLGLEEGDVLMRVNDEWVYEGRNTLVERIEQGLPVTLVVVRRGIPRLLELVAE